MSTVPRALFVAALLAVTSIPATVRSQEPYRHRYVSTFSLWSDLNGTVVQRLKPQVHVQDAPDSDPTDISVPDAFKPWQCVLDDIHPVSTDGMTDNSVTKWGGVTLVRGGFICSNDKFHTSTPVFVYCPEHPLARHMGLSDERTLTMRANTDAFIVHAGCRVNREE